VLLITDPSFLNRYKQTPDGYFRMYIFLDFYKDNIIYILIYIIY
jgi:hypothetical protein